MWNFKNSTKASGTRSKITQNDQIGEKSLAEKKVVWNDMNALVAQECVYPSKIFDTENFDTEIVYSQI